MYINTKTRQYPVTERDIRALYSNTAFPTPFVAPEEYKVVFPAPKPEHDAITKMARETTPVLTSKGTWEQRWEIVSRFQEYTDAEGVVHTVQQQEDAATALFVANKLEALKASIVQEAQRRLDDFAKTRGYDGILSLTTYATDSNAKFAQEGQRGVELRSAMWSKLYEILAEVEAGTRPTPDSIEDINTELPPLTW